jgi:hypothetical protein
MPAGYSPVTRWLLADSHPPCRDQGPRAFCECGIQPANDTRNLPATAVGWWQRDVILRCERCFVRRLSLL